MILANAPVAYVFKGERECGTIRRTAEGSVFEYLPSYLLESEDTAPSIATTIRRTQSVHPVRGVNLLPFFANLLPEGWILQTVAGRLKTSRDDLLSLLVEVGRDTVGDVWLSWEKKPKQQSDTQWDLSQYTFDRILEDQYGDPNRPVESVSIPGVQDKVSANRITLPGRIKHAPEAILKLNRSPDRFPLLIENEHFFMTLAKSCGLSVAKTRIVRDAEGSVGLWVERFDRKDGKRLHQEDGCQIMGIYPADKYNVSARDIARGLKSVCRTWAQEVLSFIELYAFCFLIVNGDLHAKNISVLEQGRGMLRLSPAYDLLSTLPYKDDRMALKMDGRDANLKGWHLIEFGVREGVPEAATRFQIEKLLRAFKSRYQKVEQVGFDAKQTRYLLQEMDRRGARLSEFS